VVIYFGIIFGVLSSVIGQRCEQSRADMPMNPNLLRFVSGTAAIVAFALIIAGFFVAWYVPLLGLVAGVLVASLWGATPMGHINPPLASILAGLVSISAALIHFVQ